MRESLFSILGSVEGLRFLDLFSGSGVVALEAISRGAGAATLVEKERQKRRTIQGNLESVLGALGGGDFEPQVRIVISPVERFIQRERGQYDIVYLDPPFAYGYKNDLLTKLAGSGLIAEGGTAILHYPKEESITPKGLQAVDEREYGRSHLLFFRYP